MLIRSSLVLKDIGDILIGLSFHRVLACRRVDYYYILLYRRVGPSYRSYYILRYYC